MMMIVMMVMWYDDGNYSDKVVTASFSVFASIFILKLILLFFFLLSFIYFLASLINFSFLSSPIFSLLSPSIYHFPLYFSLASLFHLSLSPIPLSIYFLASFSIYFSSLYLSLLLSPSISRFSFTYFFAESWARISLWHHHDVIRICGSSVFHIVLQSTVILRKLGLCLSCNRLNDIRFLFPFQYIEAKEILHRHSLLTQAYKHAHKHVYKKECTTHDRTCMYTSIHIRSQDSM